MHVTYSKIAVIIERIIKHWWFLLCGLPIVLLAVYQLSKKYQRWHFAGNIGIPEIIHWDALFVLIMALICILIVIRLQKRLTYYVPVLLAVLVVFASMGVWLQKDRHLIWEGMDVPTNNYRAALLTIDIGPLEMIKTWNARANPRVEPNYIRRPGEVLKRINRMGLNWIIGTRWDRRDLPQDNNRMVQHPPGYPLVLAEWLMIFGESRMAAFAFELFVKFCLVLIAILWAWRYVPAEETANRLAIACLICTAPPVLLFYFPHANELAALFALGGFAFGGASNSAYKWSRHIASGMLLTIAAYVNFFFVIVFVITMIMLVLSKQAWHDRKLIGILCGASIVFITFTALGYYPWLTYFTGSQTLHYYTLNHMFDGFSSVMEFSYFGFPLILMSIFSLFLLTTLRGSSLMPWMLGGLISLVAGAYLTFSFGGTARYLMGVYLLLVPLLAMAARRLCLTNTQVAMIPLANFAFVLLVVFL